MISAFFADSYAIIEIIAGNPAYEKYADQELLTTVFNLAEVYYCILKEKGTETANEYLAKYQDNLIDVTGTSVQAGMQFKLAYKKQKLSYVDCIGYALALEQNITFLTGDMQFKDKPNVEFVQ
jgi:predicted nucleic acid-binding protein